MPHENLEPPATPPNEGPRHDALVPSVPGGLDLAYDDDPFRESGGQGLNLRRYWMAVWRRKWLLVLAGCVGALGAAYAYSTLGVEYTAEGHVWVQVEQRGSGGDVGPIRQGELLQSSSWLDLLQSFAVLDPVVLAQKLYLSVPSDVASAFGSFSLANRFVPGSYVLNILDDDRRFTLSSESGTVLQRGTLGDSIGVDLGFQWRPDASAFGDVKEIPFGVKSPRDAARGLQSRMRTSIDRNGSFISLALDGSNPAKIATVVNAIMEQYVYRAALLKRGKLDEQLKILDEQLRSTEEELRQAERNLENFRVRTVTLPSDASTPIAPGLQMTQAPVYSRFFQMKVDLEQLRHDRSQLQRALDSLSNGNLKIEAFESVPQVGTSSELSRTLSELVDLRAQVRTLRNDFTDDYPPLQELLKRIGTIEHQTVPTMANALLAEMKNNEDHLATMVDSASTELTQIPRRTIEEARLTRQVTIQENLYNDLRGRVETAQLAAAGSIPDVQILDRAAVPQVPTTDQRMHFSLMILLASLGGSVALAILLDLMSGKLQYAEEVDSAIGLQILGSIPRVKYGASKKSEDIAAQVVEAFRELRVTVSFAHGTAGPVILGVTSPAQGEGKTFISTNLAVAFAEMGRRTLLIDADTRRGDAHRLLSAQRKPGLTDYLLERANSDIIQKTEYEHLEFIGCGTRGDSTPELVASPRMAAFFGVLKRGYDVIIVDCPPLAAGADALVLGGLSGNLAVVLRTGSTEKQLAVARLETLSRFPIRILGAILNDVEPRGTFYRYYASYLPGYRAGREEDESDVPSAGSRLLSGRGGAQNHPDSGA